MKKTRIIIPALAMIAFSVAASITGTVAWFTANRTAQIDAGTYAVVKTTSDLDCTVADGLGTTATDNAANDVIAVNGKLSDASFDHANKLIYEPESGLSVGKKIPLASATADTNSSTGLVRGTIPGSTAVTVYTAVTWNVTFSLDFGAVQSNDIGLFLDLSQSSFTPSNETVASGNWDTAKGFRMAFVPQGTNAANGNTRVFADLQAAAKCTYVGTQPNVGATLTGTDTSYTGKTLIDNSSDAALASSYTETAAGNMSNYLGKFPYASNSAVELSFEVVCWFEGTDENIVNSTTGHTTIFRDVTVELAFEAITFANA